MRKDWHKIPMEELVGKKWNLVIEIVSWIAVITVVILAILKA